MRKLKHIKLFEEINPFLDRSGVSPMDAMQQLFKEFRNILNKYEGKSVREVDSEYKEYWIMFIDMCKNKGVKRVDVKDFINHYIGQRKTNHVTPSLVEDDDFREAVNEIVMKFTKDLNTGFGKFNKNLNISDVSSSSNFINIQFEFIEFDDNIEEGDLFIVGDAIHCCQMLKGSIFGITDVIDTEGNIHETDSIKGIIVNPKLIK